MVLNYICITLRLSVKSNSVHTQNTWTTLLASRPFAEEKGPGTHCLRIPRYPKNVRFGCYLRLLHFLFLMNSVMVEYSTVCLYVASWTMRMAETDQWFKATLSAALLLPHIFQYNYYDWLHMLNQCFTENFMDILMHVQRVCTRSFPLCKGPGDEAKYPPPLPNS